MPIELRILSGARAGRVERFDRQEIAIGRHPLSDLRFDATRDLDVSTRHASISNASGVYALQDAGSTNGTFVNGERLAAGLARELREEDIISFGAQGPTVAVHLRRRPTTGLRLAMACGMIALGAVAVGFWISRRDAATRQTQAARRDDSVVRVARSARPGTEAVVAQQAVQRGHDPNQALNTMDLPGLHRANDAAVVLITSDVGDHTLEASGFCVRASGLIVTNRHVVSDSTTRAVRIMVKFADTPTWRRARIVKIDDDPAVDLALIQVDQPGSRGFPTVHAVAGNVDVPVGAPIATLGFVFGTDMPMEGDGSDAIAKTTLVPGTVSKTVSEVLQIDSFASHGSSGSPVIDAHDHVIGVLYGGQPGTGGRIVFAVPADRVSELLGTVR